MSDNVMEMAGIFNTYCTVCATLMKTMNFLVKFKKIVTMQEFAKEICEEEGFDVKSKEFETDLRRGHKVYMFTFLLGGFK